MASGNEIREFLTTRRARLTPAQAGLATYGGRRRVSGLRREEVALLAGVSVEYYTQIERGTVRGVSEDVLDAVARALQLDEVEKTHLFDLVRTAKQRPVRSPDDRERPSCSPASPRHHHRSSRVRPQRPTRHLFRQPARLRPVLRSLRQS
ncbi:MAG TPA: helix-turn-helix transcriptional regulator [Streptosporangiaceae bacterium]|nr:helix-turn-helix transcriptional regulator [Streptosporangiaceae bacterium]